MDCHHFGVHGERHICGMAAAHALKRSERLGRVMSKAIVGWFVRLLLLLLQLLLPLHDAWAINGRAGEAAMLEDTTVEAWAIVIITPADNLPTANNHAAMTVAQRGLRRLLKTKSEIVVSLHFCYWCVLLMK